MTNLTGDLFSQILLTAYYLCHCQSQQLSSALLSASDFKSHFCKQCGPRPDCSSSSSLIKVHTVCLYAKLDLKSLQEYSADNIDNLFCMPCWAEAPILFILLLLLILQGFFCFFFVFFIQK